MNLEKCCNTCEFCMIGDDNKTLVCAGHNDAFGNGKDTYGMPVKETKKLFPNGCCDYEISFMHFMLSAR